ncbi:MAG: hypothetical protein HamCj_00630 [Candidatus Hamiltonella defensa (Ceratovacuna japonica)]
MKLKEYLDSLKPGGHKAFARKLKVSSSFLSQMASGTSSISPARCVEIEQITEGAVTRQDLRKDWTSIWPELNKIKAAVFIFILHPLWDYLHFTPEVY